MSQWDETTGQRIADDHLLTDDIIAQCERADQVGGDGATRMPVPTQMVSNGEYPPLPQSNNQKHS